MAGSERTRSPSQCVASARPSKAMTGSPSEKIPRHHIISTNIRDTARGAGVPKEDREACLNHRNDVGSKHYDLYDRADEKRAALSKFARQLEGVIPAASK